MKVIKANNPVYIDVDDTLVLWDKTLHDKNKIVHINYYGFKEVLMPHERHIRFLKAQHARGREVIVWSQGGYRWAQAVVKALGLNKYVTAVLTKPISYVDDLHSSKFMGDNIYFKPGS